MTAAVSQSPEAPAVPMRALTAAQPRVVLQGSPNALLGVAQLYRHPVDKARFAVHTHNPAETEVGHLQQLHRAEILSSTLARQHLPSPFVALGRLPAEGNHGTVSLRLKLAPSTPPGHYQAQLQIDGQEVTAEIDVLAERNLRFLTPYIAVAGAAGETVSARLVVENAGNMAEQLSTLGRMVLQESQQICLSLQEAIAAVRKAEGDLAGFVTFANGFVAGLAARQTSAVKVGVRGGPVVLMPGEVADLALSLRLPSDLRAGRSYETVLITHNASVPVHIQALAPPEKLDTPEKPDAAAASSPPPKGEP